MWRCSRAATFGLQELAQIEQQQVGHALAALYKVTCALELTGHSPIVIKTLDHWPDIGSDLDLFIAATEADTVREMQSELQSQAAAPELGRPLGAQMELSDSRTDRDWWRSMWAAWDKPASRRPSLPTWKKPA